MDRPRRGDYRRVSRALPALTLATMLAVATTGLAMGADADAGVQIIKGDKYRMADAVMADKIARFTDPTGDQLLSDGSPATEAPAWSDVKTVHVVGSRTPAKLRTKMQSDHPPGASDSFYGSVAKPHAKDRIVFVAVEMAKKLPAGAKGQLVEIGLVGSGATPVQVGTNLDTRAGVERFSLSGRFRNGAMATGDTDISGKEPAAELEDADYYNVDSAVFGFYEPKKSTWYVVVPRAGDTDAITVSVRSTTGSGQVIDRLDLPGGGHFIDLRDPTGGFKTKAGVSPLTCRALETYSGEGGVLELSDIEATLIRYTAGVDPSVSPKKAMELLGPAIEAAGPVSVALTAVGTEATPLTVEGELSVAPEGNAVSLEFEAPEGQWSFALSDELALATPSGERIIDHSSLTGPAGVQTGPGLDGLVAGDLSCLGVDAVDTVDTESTDAESADTTEATEAVEDPDA